MKYISSYIFIQNEQTYPSIKLTVQYQALKVNPTAMAVFQQTLSSLILLQLCLIPRITHGQQQTLCVQASGNSTPSSECKTLMDWYGNGSAAVFMSDTKLVFQEGIHSLDRFLNFSNCYNFTMAGNGNAQHDSDGIPQPTSIISCSGVLDTGLFISNSRNVHIHNLEFKFCSGYYTLKERYDFAGSLTFYKVQNMSLDQVVVNCTTGYGLHTVNIYGTNEVVDSAFLNASEHQDVMGSGNADFFFDNFLNTVTILVVNSSWFMDGNNNITSGGLNVEIRSANVHVIIANITTKGNNGFYGGNLALFVALFTKNYSSIIIENSRILEGRATHGGGISILIKQRNNEGLLCLPRGVQYFLKISNTLFHKNSAKITGGAMYIIYNELGTNTGINRQVTIMKCNFTENVGDGAAMEIKQVNHYITPQLNTSIEMCRFENNFTPSNLIGPVIDLISVEVSVTNCIFNGSNTTAISLRNSCLRLFGDILFENNTAQSVGGALKFCEASVMYTHSDTHVQFVNNRAQKGGAIYIQQHCMDTKPLCFLQLYGMQYVNQTKLIFNNNLANVSGHSVYGGDIDQCLLIGFIERNLWHSNKVFHEIFKIEENYRPSEISSDPRGVCFCHDESQEYLHKYNLTCITTLGKLDKYPGEKFTVSVITVGQMNGSTSGIVNSILVNENQNHTLVRYSNPGSNASCINLTFALYSNQRTANITFKPITSEFATHFGNIFPTVTIHLLPCPIGFQLSDEHNKCTCNPLLSKFNLFVDAQVECNITSQTVSIQQRRIWFGCLHPEYKNQSATCESDSVIIVAPNCDYYCQTSNNDSNKTIQIFVNDLDSQCLPGHTGILCGACKPGYSRILGGALECQKGCTNRNLPFIIVFFLVSNVFLVIFIMYLNITVTEGTLNGLLVYTMVIQTHRTYFPVDPSDFGRVCWIFITSINLSFGSKLCFFKGMDGYQQIWALFAQAFYLLFILTFIIYLSRKFIFFTRLLRRNIINVLATLVVMLYSNLSFAIFSTFKYSFLHVSSANDTHYSTVAWYYDANVPYFGLKHSLLFVVASICSIAMIFFVFSLLLIQCLQKRSEYLCLRWVDRFRPFYEAYTGPCRDNYRFWPGFLLFMRTGVYTMNSLIPAYTDELFRIKMLVTAAVFVLIMSLACIFPRGIYKKWPLNALEFSFYLNLCITSGFLGISSNKDQNMAILYTSVSISALTTFGIFIYHCHGQVKETSVWKKLVTLCSVQACVKCIHRKPMETREPESDDEGASLLPQVLPTVVGFD